MVKLMFMFRTKKVPEAWETLNITIYLPILFWPEANKLIFAKKPFYPPTVKKMENIILILTLRSSQRIFL
jgi:hypothetical protein